MSFTSSDPPRPSTSFGPRNSSVSAGSISSGYSSLYDSVTRYGSSLLLRRQRTQHQQQQQQRVGGRRGLHRDSSLILAQIAAASASSRTASRNKSNNGNGCPNDEAFRTKCDQRTWNLAFLKVRKTSNRAISQVLKKLRFSQQSSAYQYFKTFDFGADQIGGGRKLTVQILPTSVHLMQRYTPKNRANFFMN